jgi:hypothetical protein
MMMAYSQAVRSAFDLPPTRFEGACTGHASAGGGSTVIRFCASCEGQKMVRVGFRAFACPHIIAACHEVAVQLEGRPLKAVGEIDWQALQLSLGIPVEKAGKLLIIQDALTNLSAELESAAGA